MMKFIAGQQPNALQRGSNGRFILPALIVALAATTANPVQAHENADSPVIAHLRADTVPNQTLLARGLSASLDTSRLYSRIFAPFAPRSAVAASGGDPAIQGQWSGISNWPVVAVHAVLLPTGKVLAYSNVGNQAAESYTTHNFTRATVWDPGSGGFDSVDVNTGYNIFCSGLLILPDGRAFIAGGNLDSSLNGLDTTHLFDPWNTSWTLGPFMSQGGRWYPSLTPMANGEVLITSGRRDTPEIRATDGSLRSLPGAARNLPLYPWLTAASNGHVTYFGPDAKLLSLSPGGAGSWENHGPRDQVNRTYGSYALFDYGKVLVAGGGPSTASSVVVNINSHQVRQTQPMHVGRRQHNLTLLADGTVLATGGNSSGVDLIDMGAGVYDAELWDPATEQWTVLGRMQATRQYHSIAMLLPDGRVLSAGGGVCGTCTAVNYINQNAEIFSPPYLFKKDGSGQLADRPQITGVTEVFGYNRPTTLTSPDVGKIRKLALVGLSAVTHSVNFQQRYVPLSFVPSNGSLRFTSPADPSSAPPGYYLLFAVDDAGVPSQGRFVRLDPAAPPEPQNTSPTISNPGNQGNSVGASVSLPIVANDPDGDHLTFSASGLPPGLTIDADSGLISGALTTSGSYQVSVNATDGRGGIAVGDFVWLVSQDAPPSEYGSGLLYEYYEGGWNRWPLFSKVVPTKAGVVRNFNLGPRQRDSQFVMRYRGRLQLPADGTYTFYIKASTAGRLYIDGQLVTKVRSPDIAREAGGSVALSSGQHEIMVHYQANTAGTPVLRVNFEGPGYAKQPLPKAWLSQPSNGLAYEYYEGTWDRLPKFSNLTANRVGFTSVVDLSPRQRNFDFALRFRGKLRLQKPGAYTFYLKSYRGSKVWLDEKPVLVSSGVDPNGERQVTLTLDPGDHELALGYYQTTGPGTLELSYSGPGIRRQPIGINALPNK